MQGRRVLGGVVLSILGLAVRSPAEDLYRWDSVGPEAAVPYNFCCSLAVGTIAVDPTNPSVLYAGNGRGLYKTSNSGAVWQQVLEHRMPSTLPTNVNATYWAFTLLSLDPANPSTVFAASAGGDVFRSGNAGGSWSTVLAGQGVASLHANPGGTVFACVTQAGRLACLRSVDSGSTWTEIASLAGKTVQSFAGDAANPGRVWAAVAGDPAGAVVYLSEDDGASWLPRSAGLPGTLSTALALAPDAPGTLYVLTDSGLFRTSDAGQSWEPVGRLPSERITALAAGPRSAVYVSTRLDGLYRSGDGGAHWTLAGLRDQATFTVVLDPGRPERLYAGGNLGLLRITWGPVPSCAAAADALCLQGGRFLVRSSWRARHEAGVGRALALTPDTGSFWFFQPDNVEVTVKVLDGQPVNGNFWVFFGALSNVEYVITVLDTATGAIQSYLNWEGTLASVADVKAFPADASSSATALLPAVDPSRLVSATCLPGPYALCLNQGRFRVEVVFTETPDGPSAPASAVSLTADTGYFWFFDAANVELVVKVLDGTGSNQHYWVFYGALSDVEYEVTVTDTVTGVQRSYHNDRGNLASVADTLAF